MADPLKSICEDPLERKWVWISLGLALVMAGMLGYYAVASNIHPPSIEVPADTRVTFRIASAEIGRAHV